MPRFYLQAASLMPLPLSRAAAMIRRANFDGIEVLLGRNVDHERVRAIARKHALDLNWHEIWSLEDSPVYWFNHMAAAVGRIPKRTEMLHAQLPVLREPVVCYAHRYHEIGPEEKDLLWLQTCYSYSRALSYRDFVDIVKRRGASVVFDTQHVVEWKLSTRSVNDLRKYTGPKLQGELLEAWEDLGPYTREIHFNNFVPARGHTGGRNVFPDEGVLDLAAFARVVKRSGWDGTVTPEVTSASLFTLKVPFTPMGLPVRPRLQRLRELVGQMFS